MGSSFWELRIKAQVNSHPFQILVDQGASFTVLDSDRVQVALGRGHLMPDYIEVVDVTGKSIKCNAFMPDSIEVGGITFKPQMLTATHSKSFATDHYDGLLGYEFLAEHRAIIDMGGNNLWVRP